jgi:hypothetical protein
MEGGHVPTSIAITERKIYLWNMNQLRKIYEYFSWLDTKCHTPYDKVYPSQYRMDAVTSVDIG